MAEALFRDVQADSAKLHEWEIQSKFLSEDNRKKIAEKEDVLKMMKEEILLKKQEYQEAVAKDEALKQKVDTLKRIQATKGSIQSCIEEEFKTMSQKVESQSETFSMFSEGHEALRQKMEILKKEEELSRKEFDERNVEFRKQINELQEKESLLMESQAEFLSSNAYQEAEQIKVNEELSNELSKLKLELASECQKTTEVKEQMRRKLDEKTLEAFEVGKKFEEVKSMINEHKLCSNKITNMEDAGKASIETARAVLKQSQDEKEQLENECHCALKEIDSLRARLQKASAEADISISESQHRLSELEAQKSLNKSIIDEHALCAVEIANLRQSLEQLKVKKQEAVSLHGEELIKLDERNSMKAAELESLFKNRVLQLEKLNGEISNIEKNIALECEEEAICGDELSSKKDLLQRLKSANTIAADKNSGLKSDIQNLENNLKDLQVEKEDVFNTGEKIKEKISNLQSKSLEGSQKVLSLMNTLKSKEFQMNVSKQKLEDEISCLRTKLNLAKVNQTTMLNAIESHKDCQAQEAHIRQKFDTARAALTEKLDKLKEENVEINQDLQNLRCKLMLLEPETLMQTAKKDSEIEDLKSRFKMAAERKSQFQLAIEDHKKCEEKSSKLQKSLESIISQTNKVMKLNTFHTNSMRAKHQESAERIQATVDEFKKNLSLQKEHVSNLTTANSELEAQLMIPYPESTVSNEKSPSVMSKLSAELGQLFAHDDEVPKTPSNSRSSMTQVKSP